MKTLSKILIITIITVFSLMITNTYAVDLNLTDPIDGSNTAAANTNSSNNTNTSSTNSNSTSNSSSNNTNTSNTSRNTSNSNETNSDSTTYSGTGNDSPYNTSYDENVVSPTTTTVGTATPSDEGLSISDIINIIVIAIGFILVLLGIAILIKSK